MPNEVCDCCTMPLDEEVALHRRDKIFCSVDCLKAYATDYELNRIATALEAIVKKMGA